jgi:magnesium chelatase family protein
VQLYRARLSGPLLDRIDMHVEVPAVTARELLRGTHRDAKPAESGVMVVRSEMQDTSMSALSTGCDSASIRNRVQVAREVQQRRFADRLRVRTNADMYLADLDVFCRLDCASTALIQKAVESFSLSARAAHRCLRVARTIADLAGTDEIALEHVAEAVQYQALERRG